jgi:hypothetical protein
MRSLDRCQQCSVGTMRIVTTRTRGLTRVRYLKCDCDSCKAKGKETFAVDSLGRQTSFAVGTTRSTFESSLRHGDENNGS